MMLETANRPDDTGRMTSALVPLALALLANGLIFLAQRYVPDWDMAKPAYARLAIMPPGWLVGLIWCVIFPMWGVARYEAWQAGPAGPRASNWVVALIVWALMYPLLTGYFGVGFSAMASAFSLLLALFVTWRVQLVSRRAALWLVPSLLWLAFATYLGFLALQGAGSGLNLVYG